MLRLDLNASSVQETFYYLILCCFAYKDRLKITVESLEILRSVHEEIIKTIASDSKWSQNGWNDRKNHLRS